MTLYENQKLFWQEAKKLIKENNLKELYVNSYIGSVLSDSFEDFNFLKKDINETLYIIGEFNNAAVIINSNLKYSDHKVYDKDANIVYDFEKYKDICLI